MGEVTEECHARTSCLAVTAVGMPQRIRQVTVARGTVLAAGLIVLAALAAYADSFNGAFVYDD